MSSKKKKMTGENILKFANKAPENIFLKPRQKQGSDADSPRTAFMHQRWGEPGLSHARLGATATGLRRQETDRERLTVNVIGPCGWYYCGTAQVQTFK